MLFLVISLVLLSGNTMKLGFILKELRIIKKASQKQIANSLYVERSTYAKWETGRVMLRVDQLKDLANLYGLEFEYIVRCIEAEKLISKEDVLRFIYQQEQKELIK